MRLKSLFSAVFLSLAGAGTVAALPGVECLQNQMTAAGYNVGPVNGEIDDSLRQALRAFAAKNNMPAKLALHPYSAIPYCRMVGLEVKRLKRHWPGRSKPFATFVDAKVNKAVSKRIFQQLKSVRKRAAKQFDLELAGQDKVIVASGPGELLSLIEKNTEYPAKGLGPVAQRHCSREDGIGAAVLPGMVFFCINPELTKSDSDWKFRVDYVVAHEMVHLIQMQVAGTSRPGSGEREKLKRDGPVWLVEGFADAFALQGRDGMPSVLAGLITAPIYGDQRKPDLRRLELRSALRGRIDDVYQAGMIASLDLIRGGKNMSRFGVYCELLASGFDWPQAFQRAFGLTPAQFYAAYDQKHRR